MITFWFDFWMDFFFGRVRSKLEIVHRGDKVIYVRAVAHRSSA